MRRELKEEYNADKKSVEESKERRLLKHIPNQINQLNEEYVKLCEFYVGDSNQMAGFKLTHFTGKAFVSF